jgi:hypothetical protein
MGGKRSPRRRAARARPEGIPVVVAFALMGGALLGYLAGETGWALSVHPIHWSVAAVGGLAGWLVGKLLYRWRGDII